MSRVMSIGTYEVPEIDDAVDPPVAPEQAFSGRSQQDQTVSDEIVHDQATELMTFRPARAWNPENFEREQIRGLVRQIFFSQGASAVRQVVFSPIDTETDVRRICRRVGETLALETTARVAVAGEYPKVVEAKAPNESAAEKGTILRQAATRMRSNLWLVPLDRGGNDCFSGSMLRSHMGGLRREFEYSIVETVPAGMSNEATAMAQLSDGIVLVLSAHHTRRATARNIKERLEFARACILGAVLCDRVFPIPETIYRRL